MGKAIAFFKINLKYKPAIIGLFKAVKTEDITNKVFGKRQQCLVTNNKINPKNSIEKIKNLSDENFIGIYKTSFNAFIINQKEVGGLSLFSNQIIQIN